MRSRTSDDKFSSSANYSRHPLFCHSMFWMIGSNEDPI